MTEDSVTWSLKSLLENFLILTLTKVSKKKKTENRAIDIKYITFQFSLWIYIKLNSKI